MVKRCSLILLLAVFAGCENAGMKSPASGKSVASRKSGKSGPGGNGKVVAPQGFARLMPPDVVFYYRIRDVKKVVKQLIQPQHVKDAAKLKLQVNQLIAELMLKQDLGLQMGSMLAVFEIDAVHFGMTMPTGDDKSAAPEFLAVIHAKKPGAFDGVIRDVGKAANRNSVREKEILPWRVKNAPPLSLVKLDDTTVIVGSERLVRSAIERDAKPDGKSLAGEPAFQRAFRDWNDDGEVFAFVNLTRLRRGVKRRIPFNTISHFAASLRIDGGVSMRAYAANGKRFPEFHVRTPRERKFLSRIPAEAAFILGTGTENGTSHRRNFIRWVMQELGDEDEAILALLPERWRKLAADYQAKPDRIENEAFVIIKDLWKAALPIKSESAFFIAPDKSGRWGTAFLFDVADKEQVRQLTRQVFETGSRTKLPWKETVHEGLKIRYVDFAEIARNVGKPVPAEVARQAQLQVGYAEGESLYFLGTLEAIKFAHKPTGKTLDKELAYDNVDAKNAILLSLQPGRVLHRTFGVPQVDRLLKAFASQIPEDSNYAVTLNFAPKQLTLRTNIPFVSLFVWLALEMQGKGPAKLHELLQSGSRDAAPAQAQKPMR